jgi:hypothetical protein
MGIPVWPFLCLIFIGIAACAGSGMTSYTGRLAKPESMVRLSAGDARELKWETNDLIIDALYALGPNSLDLAGRVVLQSRLQHYPIVGRLRIEVHALDGDGVILGTYPLWSAGHNTSHYFVNWAFQRNFAVPDNTRALTFSYRGQMRDGGGWGGRMRDREGDGVSWDFWHTP